METTGSPCAPFCCREFGGIVAIYRLYLLESVETHIAGYKEFDAPDDAAAIRVADGFAGEYVMDLWCDRRKVRRFQPCVVKPSSTIDF